MAQKILTIAEVRRRSDGEILYGDIIYSAGRVTFIFLDANQDPDTASKKRIYKDALSFSREWQILAILPMLERD